MEESLKGLMVTFEIPSVVKTKIVEIFPYVPGTLEKGEVIHKNEYLGQIHLKVEDNSPNINVDQDSFEEE